MSSKRKCVPYDIIAEIGGHLTESQRHTRVSISKS